MALTVDSREHDLIEALTAAGEPHRVATLDAGDLAVAATAGGPPVLVLERKTWADFAASIVDGRYAEQKARLGRMRLAGGPVVGFLFEGAMPPRGPGARGGLSPARHKGLLSAQLSTVLRDGFPSIYTQSLADTVATLALLAARCARGAPRPLLRPGGPSSAPHADVVSAPPLSKKHAQYGSAEAVYVRQLMCVSRVSQAVAQGLARRWPSHKQLRAALRTRGELAKTVVKGRKAKLGPALEQALRDAFVGAGV
jgi:ERCC4-type nuclease